MARGQCSPPRTPRSDTRWNTETRKTGKVIRDPRRLKILKQKHDKQSPHILTKRKNDEKVMEDRMKDSPHGVSGLTGEDTSEVQLQTVVDQLKIDERSWRTG